MGKHTCFLHFVALLEAYSPLLLRGGGRQNFQLHSIHRRWRRWGCAGEAKFWHIDACAFNILDSLLTPRVPPRPSIALAVVTSPRPARDPQTEQQRRCVEVTQACFCTNGSICNANKYHQHASSPLHPHWMLVDVVSSWHKVPKNNTTLVRQCGDSVVAAWYQRDTSVVTARFARAPAFYMLPAKTSLHHAWTCMHMPASRNTTSPNPPHTSSKNPKN